MKNERTVPLEWLPCTSCTAGLLVARGGSWSSAKGHTEFVVADAGPLPHLAWSTAGADEAPRGLGPKPHVRTPLSPPDSSEPEAASPGSPDGEGADPGLCGPGPGHWAECLPELPAGSPDLVCSLVIILETLFVPLQGGRRGAVERRAPPFKRRLERFCGL